MKCRVCDQEITDPTEAAHHLERSPIDSALCLGCWIGWLEMEKFLIRATGGTFWSLGVYDAMKEFIKLAQKHQPRFRE